MKIQERADLHVLDLLWQFRIVDFEQQKKTWRRAAPLAQRPNMGFKVVSFEWGNISTNKKYLLNCRSCLQNLRGEHIENVISLILLLLFLLFYVCGFFQTHCILSLFPSYNVGCSPLGWNFYTKCKIISLKYTNNNNNNKDTTLYLEITNMVDFSHTCAVFTKHLNTS